MLEYASKLKYNDYSFLNYLPKLNDNQERHIEFLISNLKILMNSKKLYRDDAEFIYRIINLERIQSKITYDYRKIEIILKNYISQFIIIILSFIQVKILTNILSISDYGIYSEFIALLNLFTVLFSLNLGQSFIRIAVNKSDEDNNKYFFTIVVTIFCYLFYMDSNKMLYCILMFHSIVSMIISLDYFFLLLSILICYMFN